jgi:hypothetical protein
MVSGFQAILWLLQGIAALVVVAAGIPNIVKQWKRASRTRFVDRTVLFAPLGLNLCGIAAAFLKEPLIAVTLFIVAFIVQIIAFRRDPSPVDRNAVVMFGVLCCAYTLLVSMVIVFSLIGQIVDQMGKIIELIGKVAH